MNFFKKRYKNNLMTPIEGKCIDLESVNDPVFSQKMMGEGIAILPTSTLVVSPCDGEITLISDANHAFGMVGVDGVEILIHLGIDTVKYKGEGFKRIAQVGKNIKQGEPVLEFNIDYFEKENIDTTVMLILLNHDKFDLDYTTNREVTYDTTVIEYIKK